MSNQQFRDFDHIVSRILLHLYFKRAFYYSSVPMFEAKQRRVKLRETTSSKNALVKWRTKCFIEVHVLSEYFWSMLQLFEEA